MGGLRYSVTVSEPEKVYKIADLEQNIRGAFELLLDRFGISFAMGYLTLRGESNSINNNIVLKTLVGTIKVFTDSTRYSVYIQLPTWTMFTIVPISGIIPLQPIEVDIDTSTLTLVEPS